MSMTAYRSSLNALFSLTFALVLLTVLAGVWVAWTPLPPVRLDEVVGALAIGTALACALVRLGSRKPLTEHGHLLVPVGLLALLGLWTVFVHGSDDARLALYRLWRVWWGAGTIVAVYLSVATVSRPARAGSAVLSL